MDEAWDRTRIALYLIDTSSLPPAVTCLLDLKYSESAVRETQHVISCIDPGKIRAGELCPAIAILLEKRISDKIRYRKWICQQTNRELCVSEWRE